MAEHSAPGQHCRKGITLLDAVHRFGAPEQAEAWFIASAGPTALLVRTAKARTSRNAPAGNRSPSTAGVAARISRLKPVPCYIVPSCP